MKRLTDLLARGVARLAFWRKSAAPVEGAAEIAPSVAPTLSPVVPSESGMSPVPTVPDYVTSSEELEIQEIQELLPGLGDSINADHPAMPSTPGLLDGLADMEMLEVEAAATAPVVADQTAENVAPPPEAAEVTEPVMEEVAPAALAQAMPAVVDEAPAVEKLSVLARLKALFQRKPKPDGDPTINAPVAATEQVEEGADAEATLTAKQRMMAVLARKRVWIPALSLLVLVPIVVMAMLLLQSGKEKAHLQAELLATQNKLKQPPKVEPVPDLMKPMVAAPVAAAPEPLQETSTHGVVKTASKADVQSLADDIDCSVSDKESVAKNLKNCIELFNRASGR